MTENASVLSQREVARTTNEHQAALELLGVLPLAGKVITADAMFTHRDVCDTITHSGGDYVLAVGDNQPELKRDIEDAFSANADFSPYQQRVQAEQEQSARTVDQGHGRLERRSSRTTTMLNAYRCDWPKLAQVIRVERERRQGGETTVEVAYYITRLDRQRDDATRLLGLIRSHWGIENRLHYVRDMTFGADASRVRSGSAPQVLAAFRNTVIHLLEGVEATSKAAAPRRLAARPEEAMLLIST